MQAIQRFGNQVAGIDKLQKLDLLTNDLPLGLKDLKAAKALKCEGLLVMGLDSIRAGDSNTVKWAKDILRTQLGEITSGVFEESDVHPGLLEAARAAIGS